MCMEARPSEFLGLACVAAETGSTFSVEQWTRLVVLHPSLLDIYVEHFNEQRQS